MPRAPGVLASLPRARRTAGEMGTLSSRFQDSRPTRMQVVRTFVEEGETRRTREKCLRGTYCPRAGRLF